MASTKKKLAIIDGKSVFYRGYYAMPGLSTRDGTPTGGVYGFAAMALELVKRLQPDYVAVAWDKPKTNIRKRVQMYPAYKAGRKPAPPDFYAQIPILHELLDAFGWPLYELDDYEADDIMGALGVQASKKGIETMLITSDLDVLQLVEPNVHVYALKKGLTNIELYNPESFEKKYGLKTEQFLDLKALKGDSSDNIPGVPGVGEKTAIELLKQYKTLDGVYENTALMKETLRKKIEAGKDSAYLSKKIAQIWTDAPIKLDLEAMDTSKANPARLREILQELEFKSLVRQLPEHMQSTEPKTETLGGTKLSVPASTFISKDADLSKIDLGGAKTVYIHSRSAGKQGVDPQVLVLATDDKAYVLDLTQLSKDEVTKALKEPLENKALGKVGYDLKSSLELVSRYDIALSHVEHDVLVGAFLINALVRAQSLTDLAIESLRYEGASFESLPPEDFLQRAPEVIAVVRELAKVQLTQLKDLKGVEKLAQTVEWPLIPVLGDMELTGVKLDCDYLKKFSKELAGAISDLEQTIYGHADKEFNISSPGQLAEILFTELQLPHVGIKKGKTGYSTAASELLKLRGLHPIIDLISQYREMTKLKSTYVDALPKLVDDKSRVHTTFNLTIAATGRLSSTDPNLQNIPIRTALGKRIRTAFVVDRGNVLVSADYSQFELRLAAVLAGEPSMIELFNKDADIHIATAAEVHGIKPEQVTKEQRYEAKAVNFGILYGQGPHGLSAGTGMGFKEAKDFIDRYFEIRPNLKKYIDKTRKQADEEGYVETLLGRRRPTPDVKSSNFAVREAAYRAAVNMPIQGTAADLTKLAMIKVAEKLDDKCKMLLQIHDSILIECPAGDADKVSKLLKQTMENVYELPVKLTVDVHTGKNWGEL